MKYQIYREEVLAKTTGENIHEVNGLLGHVLNSLRNHRFYIEKKRPASADQVKVHLDKSLLEIGKITGVKYTEHNLEV